MVDKEDRGWMQAPVFVMVLGGILMYLADTFVDPNRVPASNKPYTTFEDFFPFYLTEHSNLVCRRLHFVGSTLVLLIGLAHPTLFMNGAAVASLGLGLMPFFTHMPHGFIEGGIVLLLFVLLGKHTTRTCVCRGWGQSPSRADVIDCVRLLVACDHGAGVWVRLCVGGTLLLRDEQARVLCVPDVLPHERLCDVVEDGVGHYRAVAAVGPCVQTCS